MSLELHGAIQPNKTNKGVFAGSQIVAALPRWRDTGTVSQRTKWNAGENRFLKENYRRKVFSTSFKDTVYWKATPWEIISSQFCERKSAKKNI